MNEVKTKKVQQIFFDDVKEGDEIPTLVKRYTLQKIAVLRRYTVTGAQAITTTNGPRKNSTSRGPSPMAADYRALQPDFDGLDGAIRCA